MKKKLVLLLTAILIISFMSLVGSEENFSLNTDQLVETIEANNSAEIFNTSGDVSPLGPDVGWCQPSYCDSKNYESNEGPGGSYCCSNQGGSSGYEECTKYISKSTVYVYWWSGGLKDQQTDYCKDSSTLVEYYMDCNFWEDAILSIEKNCNDYDMYGDWEYYCTSTEVRKHRRFYNVGCVGGACTSVSNNYVDDTLLSKKGEDNYCSERTSRGCSLCARGDYDCDYNTECSIGLECKGPIGGALDGCCYSSDWWDENNYRCCECSSGPCCDGCHYRSSSYVCDSHVSGSDQYKCDSNCLDYDVLKRYQKQYCSSSSSSCTGTKEWVQYNYENCISPEYCSGSTLWGTTIPTCKNAQCTSGECCDTTCGVYNYRPASYVCINDLIWYGCPWGNALGSDVGKKVGDRYCNGYASACNGGWIWGSWTVKQDCSLAQYCEGEEGPNEFWCKSIACSSDSDCLSDYWSWLECKNNDVWGMFEDRSCVNPGTKESYCNLTETYKKKEDCGENGYVGDPYCNMIGQIFRDYATRWCEDNSCHETIEAKFIKACLTGCTNGVCNEDVCTNECSSGQTRCNGNIKQTCGNYDADTCLEWGGDFNCGSDYCESWQANYCKNNSVYHNRTCHGKGCSSGVCYDNTNIEEQLVENCNYGCGNGNCTQKLQGDVNGDCKVDIFDLAAVGLCYGEDATGSCEAADLNSDGKVNIFDLAEVGLNYGRSC